LERDPDLVLQDVLEKYVSIEKAREIYGVVFTGKVEEETLAIDLGGTARRRNSLRAPTHRVT